MDVNRLSPPIHQLPTHGRVDSKPSQKVEQNLDKAIEESRQQTGEKSEALLNEAVDKINKTAAAFDRALKFQVHEETDRTVVSVLDIESDKVIREIPSQELLDLFAKMEDYIGMIFDKKV